MSRSSDSVKLSRRERQIMDVLYAKGEATITEILADLPDPPMRGALRTLLSITVRKGFASRRLRDRQFVYRPARSKEQAGKTAMRRVLDVFFGGSLEAAVSAHLSDPRHLKSLTPADLKQLAELIEQARRRGN